MNVTVIGTGYVGTVRCLPGVPWTIVTCVDTDANKINKLKAGQTPIYEPGLEELMILAKSNGHLEFLTDLAPAVRTSDVVFIAVGTPPMPGGEANLVYLEAAARGIGRAMDGSRFTVIVNKSTVPVGCGNLVETLVREGIREARPEGVHSTRFGVASNPEFLREGSAIEDS
jgi:UDPglucose 6-dehydrogenase